MFAIIPICPHITVKTTQIKNSNLLFLIASNGKERNLPAKLLFFAIFKPSQLCLSVVK